MGLWHSKRPKQPVKTTSVKVNPAEKPEDISLNRLRDALSQDLDTFLLNNILLSVQFFDNFEREIGNLRVSTGTEKDAERNLGLAKHQRHCLSPDRLYEVVGKHVRFRTKHGEQSRHYELLHSPRVLVVQNNVEVTESRDVAEYSSLEIPYYRFTLEKTTNKGYVKLRAQESSLPHIRRTTYETINDDSDEGVYTHIPSDTPEESDSIKTDPDRLDDKETFGTDHIQEDPSPPESLVLTEGRLMMMELQKEIESAAKGQQFPNTHPILKPTARKISRKLEFGPQNPEFEKKNQINFTLTERRLSGIIKAKKYLEMNDRVFRNKKINVLSSAISLPNLALPSEGSPSNNDSDVPNVKINSSPKNSDSSGYKSDGGSPKQNTGSPRSRSSDSEYGYATITELSTPKPLKEHCLGRVPHNTAEIPMECFFTIDTKVIHDDDDDDDSIYKCRRSLFETRYYLNSILFMRSFADVFSERLALPLGFTSGVNSATLQGTKIYCDIDQYESDSKPTKIRNEIIPTIFSSIWPKEAIKWKNRVRNRVPDPRPEVAYCWPTQPMLDQVQRLGCHLLPLGYMPTRGRNSEQYLEWQLAFPEAERYLETWLTHSQVRCMLFTMALYKSYLEPLNAQLGLLPSHIRTLLFWQCERNYVAWPEDRPGETLSKFLHKLYDVIMHKNLPDYFIPRRNLFESTPRPHLLKIQEKLLRIRENLVMNTLLAVRNLRYVESSFYPVLDCNRLYKIIISDNPAELLNPHMQAFPMMKPITPKTKLNDHDSEYEESDEDEDNSATDLWKTVVQKDPKKKWKKNARTQIEIERVAQELAKPAPPKPRRHSADSIDIKIQPKKRTEPLRKKALLEFFIPHFIEMAKKSNSFRSTRQAKFYAQHAERLTKLLTECEDSLSHGNTRSWKYTLEIRTLREEIENEQPHTARSKPQSLPEVPKSAISEEKLQLKKPENSRGKKLHNAKPATIQTVAAKTLNLQHEKTELNNHNPSTAEKPIREQLPLPTVGNSVTVTRAEVYESSSNNTRARVYEPRSNKIHDKPRRQPRPSNPEIVFNISENLPSSSKTVTVKEVETAESTDF